MCHYNYNYSHDIIRYVAARGGVRATVITIVMISLGMSLPEEVCHCNNYSHDIIRYAAARGGVTRHVG